MKKITFFILMGLVSIQAYAYGQLSCINVTNGDFTFSGAVNVNSNNANYAGLSHLNSRLTKSQRTVGKNSWRICKGFSRDIEDAQRRCRKIGETIYEHVKDRTDKGTQTLII